MLIELQLETAKIQSQMQQLNGKFDTFGATVQKQSNFLTQFKATAAGLFAGNAVFAGLNMLKNGFANAIRDAQEYEVLLNKTKAVIESTGNLAGISAQGLMDQAAALEQVSLMDEKVILNGQNVIATFTNIRNVAGAGNDIFNQTTQAALDLSTALGQDMQSSAIQLGKALNDPLKGVTALQRVGVAFTASQKQMIKALVESGDVMGAQKIILAEMKVEFGGAAAAAGDTFAGAVFRAKDKMQDFARDLVTNVQPILLKIGKTIGDLYNKYLAPLFSFLAKNKEVILAFAAAIVVGYTAIKVYNAILVVSKGVQTAWTVASTIMKGAQLASIASTNGMAASMLRLNMVMRANPIGLIVSALAILAAGFVYAWNHSETFRKIVVKGLQIVLNGVGYLVGALSKMIGLFAKIPGMGWAKGIADGASKAANEIRKVSDGLDGLTNKRIKLPSFGAAPSITGEEEGGALAPNGGPTASQMKAAEAAAKKRVKDLEASKKKLTGLYDDLAKLEQKKADLTLDYEKKVAERRMKYDEDVLKAKTDTNKKLLELEKNYLKQIDEAQKAAAQRRKEIIQQSIDSLRDVFKSSSAIDVGKMFADLLKGQDPTSATAGTLVDNFKKQLADIKQLAANASALSNAGFSQTFIEQVIGQGTDVGNKLAAEILNATPETVTQLQTLFGEIQETSSHGVDALGATMYEKMGLATEALRVAYEQVGFDLAENLAKYAIEFADSTTQVKADLVETLAELQKDLNKDLAEMQDAFHVAMAGINSEIQAVIASINQLFALMAQLGGLGGGTGGGGGGGGGATKSSNIVPDTFNPGSFRLGEAKSMINVNIVNNNTQSDAQTSASVLTAIKYGQVIELTGRR